MCIFNVCKVIIIIENSVNSTNKKKIELKFQNSFVFTHLATRKRNRRSECEYPLSMTADWSYATFSTDLSSTVDFVRFRCCSRTINSFRSPSVRVGFRWSKMQNRLYRRKSWNHLAMSYCLLSLWWLLFSSWDEFYFCFCAVDAVHFLWHSETWNSMKFW